MAERRPSRRIMREFVIKELSAVDKPAQAHALAVIMKRDDEGGEAHTKAEANYREADGSERCGNCEHFDGEGGCSLVAGEISASDTCDYFEQGEDAMTDAEKKQLDELQKSVTDLTAKLAAATDAAKKSGEIQKALDAATAKLEELTKGLEKAEAEKADAIAKAGMSDDEKDYMDGLKDDESKKAFMGMSRDDRKKKMKKSADEDPVVYKAADGTEFRKSAGDHVIALAKRADASDKRAAEESEKRETSELSKRADEELKAFSDDVAKRDDKVEALRAIEKMEEGPRKALLKMLEVGGKAIEAAFATIGHRNENVAKSATDFNKRVSEIQARDKISKLDALEKARVEFPAEFQAYQAAGAVIEN